MELLEVLVANPAATNSDLAQRLHVSENAVKKYLKEIYRAVGAQNRSECLVMLLQTGVVVVQDELTVQVSKTEVSGQRQTTYTGGMARAKQRELGWAGQDGTLPKQGDYV
ncbi:MAG: response regulator transcription factor [Chloroflexi bacterium]|nr:response regulator transcription factor [Chloroflexota bacterium]